MIDGNALRGRQPRRGMPGFASLLATACLIVSANAAFGNQTPVRLLEETAHKQRATQQAAERTLQQRHQLTLDRWHCVGPFKNDAFGGLYESFEYLFAPEKEALASEGVRDPKNRQGNFTASNRPWPTPERQLYETVVPEGAPARMMAIAKAMAIPRPEVARLLKTGNPRKLGQIARTSIRFNEALARL